MSGSGPSDGSGGMGPNSGGPIGPSSGMGGPGVLNGDGLDAMKSSPANGPGTPRDDGGGGGAGMTDYNLGGFTGAPQDSVSLLEQLSG